MEWNHAMLVSYLTMLLPVLKEVNHLHGKFAQVLELYDNEEVGRARKNESIHNHGMASYHLLDDVLGD
jgi:hypothetical protein